MPTIAELEQRLEDGEDNLDPRQRIDIMNQLAAAWRNQDIQQAIEWGERAHQQVTKQQPFYTAGLAESLRQLSICYVMTSKYDQALAFALEALELFSDLPDQEKQASVLTIIGNVYQGLGHFTEALSYHLKSLKIKEELSDQRGQAVSLVNIGNAYHELKDYQQALQCYEEGLIRYREINYQQGIAAILSNIGSTHFSMGNNEQARQAYHQSLEIYRDHKNQIGESATLNNLGNVYEHLNQLNEAQQVYAKALTIKRQIGDRHGESVSLEGLGRVYTRQRQYDLAQTHLEQAREIAEAIKSKARLSRIQNDLATLFYEQGNYHHAFDALKASYQQERDILNDESDRRAKNLQLAYQVEKAQKEAEIYRLRNVELAQLNEQLQEALKTAEIQRNRAEQANEFKGELIDIVAHDLRNPLQTILGYIQLTLRHTDPDTNIAKYQQRAQESAQRMIMLVQKLMNASLIESGKFKLEPESVDFYQLVSDQIDHYQAIAKRKHQTIHFTGHPPCWVYGDPIWLREIVGNLLSNAIKYSPLQKSIWVELVTSNGLARFQVKDEGLGLTEDDKHRLFGKFQRLSAKPTGEESSIGLGLFIVKQLVRMHGGAIQAKSSGQYQGSTFTIEFPLLDPPKPLT